MKCSFSCYAGLLISLLRVRVWWLSATALLSFNLASVYGQGFLEYFPVLSPPAEVPWFWAYRLDTLPGQDYRLTCLSDGNRMRWQFYADEHGAPLGYDSLYDGQDVNMDQIYWLPDGEVVHTDVLFFEPQHTYVWRRAIDGALIWEAEIIYPDTVIDPWQTPILHADDTSVLLSNQYTALIGGDTIIRMVFTKLGVAGQQLWQITLPFGSPDVDAQYSVGGYAVPLPDGGYICDYLEVADPSLGWQRRLVKIDGDGEIVWMQHVPLTYTAPVSGVAVMTSLGKFVGTFIDQLPTNKTWLIQYSNDGVLEYKIDLATFFVQALVPDQTGGVVAIGASQGQFRAMRFDAQGQLIWQRPLPILNGNPAYFRKGLALADGSFLFGGAIASPQPTAVLLKMDSLGRIYPNAVAGAAALDESLDCSLDTVEILGPTALAQWPMQLEHNGFSYYTATDEAGTFLFNDLDTGAFSLRLISPSYLWRPCPAVVDTLMPDTVNYTMTLNVPVQLLADCPLMTIEAGALGLRRCFPNPYVVRYCNAGTATAAGVEVMLVLDPGLVVNGASAPYTLSGDTLRFAIGTVPALECGDITVTLTADCDSTALGQALCLAAYVSPDTLCVPPPGWSGATIVAAADCLGDSIRFSLRNAGTGPSTPGLDFIVVDDHVIMFQDELPTLQPGQEFVHQVAADGDTWHIISEQEPNHPAPELPSIGVEGCGAAAPGEGSLGFLLDVANADGDPFSEHVCETVVGSWDPNDKQAIPRGVGPEHSLEPGVPLAYKLRFQNTGTDTAFTVVIRDTLPAGLDPATVRPGASSHPYTWALSGPGIVTFTFANIALPDSNVNEPASHGFVDFEIGQKPDLPLGSVVENRAAIYFDFNDPVLTNTVWHTIDLDFLENSTRVPELERNVALAVYPNPASETAFVVLPAGAFKGGRCHVYDAFGRLVARHTVTGPEFRLERRGLPAGLYTIVLLENALPVASGRVAWR
jgi:uncharacterized repeat protein (TIGR01451 family)